MNRKDVLGEIDTYRHNAHGLPFRGFEMDDFDITILALHDLPCGFAATSGRGPFIRYRARRALGVKNHRILLNSSWLWSNRFMTR